MIKFFGYVFIFLFIMSCEFSNEKIDSSIKNEVTPIEKETIYTCSMHPSIKEDHPGKCPICAMSLSKIEIEHGHDHSALKNENYRKNGDKEIIDITLSEKEVSHFRASIFKVTNEVMQKRVHILGLVKKSERRQSNISAKIPGRVEEVFVSSTGSLIKRGDPVVKLYSPKLLGAGEEYLISKENYSANSGNKDLKSLYTESRERLIQWGILDKQIRDWEKKRKIPREVIIYSNFTGIVEKKNAIEGRYFKEGESFFDIVDLSNIWVELDVYEHDSSLVELGQEISIEFIAYPGEIWNGKVDFISPILNVKTRTLKIRITLVNNKGKLKPGMVGRAELLIKREHSNLVVPQSAIIDSGLRKRVWVKNNKNNYISKTIVTGFESLGLVEVKSGLDMGDEVVTEGNFLLDAQSRILGGYRD